VTLKCGATGALVATALRILDTEDIGDDETQASAGDVEIERVCVP